MTQQTTHIKVADDGNHAEDVVEGMDRLTVETRDDVLITSATVARMEATDVGDGFLNYLLCGRTSKQSDKDDDTYGFQNETESEETRRKLSRNLIFDKSMERQVNTGEKPIPNEAATSHTTATEYTGKATGKQEQLSSAVNPNAYDFTHKKRGYMVLIVNDVFFKYKTRYGANRDMQKSNEIANKLGFLIQNRNKENNLNQAKMLRVLREAQKMDYSDSDCFALVISTHGLEYPNPRVNGKLDHALVCSDDKLVFTSTIIDMFSDRECPTLKNKPRLFFIQACRGVNVDSGADVAIAHHRKVDDRTRGVTGPDPARESVDEQDTQPWYDTSNSLHGGDHPIRSHLVDTPSLKCDNDCLVMYAIPPGMAAWRSTRDGSWMINYLHKVIMENNMAESNLLSLLTKVSAKMSQRETCIPSDPSMHQKKAVSVIEHKLTKDVIFTPKSAMSTNGVPVIVDAVTQGVVIS